MWRDTNRESTALPIQLWYKASRIGMVSNVAATAALQALALVPLLYMARHEPREHGPAFGAVV